jgi:putative ABC transport system permease protein
MYLIAVYPVPGIAPKTLARQISTALSQQDLRVLTGQDRGLAEFPDAASQSTSLVPLSGASGGLMTGVAIFIVASTLALSVQLRRRQIALLRAIGTTAGQPRRLVLGERLLLALPAAALALLPSRPLGRTLLAAFADHGLVAHQLVYHQGIIPALARRARPVPPGRRTCRRRSARRLPRLGACPG